MASVPGADLRADRAVVPRVSTASSSRCCGELCVGAAIVSHQPGGRLTRRRSADVPRTSSKAALLKRCIEIALAGDDEEVPVADRCGGLDAGISSNEARDIVWVLNAPELYVTPTRKRRWSHRHYQSWVRDALIKMLTRPAEAGEPSSPL